MTSKRHEGGLAKGATKILLAAAGVWAAGGACIGAGGASRASRPGDKDAHVQTDCVLVADGAVCTFTARGKPGSRCVKVMYAAVGAGTVTTSDQVCSGRLQVDESATLVVHFATRPGDACARNADDCLLKTVDPEVGIDAATAWQAEVKQSYKGPVTRAECKQLIEHRYEVYMRSDCDVISVPQERDECRKNLLVERDQDMQYQVEDCAESGYMSRELFRCQLAATNIDAMLNCEGDYYEGGRY
jgi:hypothetical protein